MNEQKMNPAEMNEQQISVVFDAERMKYPNTGLFHFCRSLGRALVAASAHVHASISIYLHQENRKEFEAGTLFVDHSQWHKMRLPNMSSFDIWHATHQSTSYFPFRKSVKVVLTIHDLNFLHEKNRSAKKQQSALKSLQKKIDRADSVVAISHFVSEDIKKFLNIDPTKLTVIYNGCNIDPAIIPQQPSSLTEGPFLFTIGTVVAKKNFHVLPALLVGNHYRLFIAGVINQPAYKEKILKEAKRLSVEDRVVFLNAISESEKYWYYEHCAAFVFPSLMEGFGLPVIEAMAFGKPVFVSNLTSLPEIAGDAAFYFEHFDETHMQQVFADGMAISAAEPLRVEKIKQQAKRFSWEQTAKEYLSIYHQLCAP